MQTREDIRGTDLAGLESYFIAHGEKKYRARQVFEWLWKKSAGSFSEMTNLPAATRDMLEAHFAIRPACEEKKQVSADGTVKTAFRLHDGHLVEGVLIPSRARMTACVSSQVGCSLTCAFCATGAMKRIRNLEAGEIYDQVVRIGQQAMDHYGVPLSNIVYMGMGEPLLNFRNVVQSIVRITSADGLNMAPRRVTVSTAGIAGLIRKLADEKTKCNLALSLHAADDEKRNAIMPINESNNLEELAGAVKYYHLQTRRGITLEYILFADFNDSIRDAALLSKFARLVPCKVNLIEYNPVDGAEFRKADAEQTAAFRAILQDKGLQVNIRKSRGKDIDAACGQLANKIVSKPGG